jgi:hypothetical protein
MGEEGDVSEKYTKTFLVVTGISFFNQNINLTVALPQT